MRTDRFSGRHKMSVPEGGVWWHFLSGPKFFPGRSASSWEQNEWHTPLKTLPSLAVGKYSLRDKLIDIFT